MTEKIKYATFFERLLSIMIDSLVYSMLIFIPLVKISVINDFTYLLHNTTDFILFILFMSAFILPFEIVMVSKFGGTIGKLLMGLKVQKEDGGFLTFKDSFIRLTLGKSVSGLFFGFGYFWMFKNDKHQTWHDIINQSVVVKKINYGWLIGILMLIVFLIINLGVFAGTISGFASNYSFYSSLFTP